MREEVHALIEEEDIIARVKELAEQIQNEYDIVQSLEFTSRNWAIYMLVF